MEKKYNHYVDIRIDKSAELNVIQHQDLKKNQEYCDYAEP